MGKSSLPIFPHLRAKSQAESSAMAQAVGPLGNLAARQTDRQRASLSGKGESATSERESQERT